MAARAHWHGGGIAALCRRGGLALALVALSACELPPPDPLRVAADCEARARAAQGPTGAVAVGIGSNDGVRTGAAISVSGDYLRGRDPLEVYDECVWSRTGQAPIRPPRLR